MKNWIWNLKATQNTFDSPACALRSLWEEPWRIPPSGWTLRSLLRKPASRPLWGRCSPPSRPCSPSSTPVLLKTRTVYWRSVKQQRPWQLRVWISLDSVRLAVNGVLNRSARVNLGKEEVRCNERILFDGVQWVRLPSGTG